MDPQNSTPQPSESTAPGAAPGSNFNTNVDKKQLIKWGIIGGVVLVVIIALAIILPKVFGVSKVDYSEASSKITDVKSAYNKIGSVYLSSSSTETEISNGIDTIKSARADFNKQFDELGNLKAIRNDGDIKKLYAAAKDQQPDFNNALDATFEAYNKILPAVSSYSDLSISSNDLAGGITSIKSKFDSISGLKNDNNKSFVSKMSSLLSKYAALAQKVQAGRDDYKKYDSNTSSEFYATGTEISKAVRDWQSNLQKLLEKGEMRDKLKALDDAVLQKTLSNK